MAYRVVKVEEDGFSGKFGEAVVGLQVYLVPDQDESNRNNKRIFLTEQKLKSYEPKVGDVVQLFYNDFNKVDCLLPVSMPI